MRKFKLFLTLLTLVIFGSGQMWGDTYKKVTSLSGVTNGDYVIVGCQTSSKYGLLTYVDLNKSRIPFTSSYASHSALPTTITDPAGASVWTLAVTASNNTKTTTLYNATNSKYIASNASTHDGKYKYDANSGMSFTVTYTSGDYGDFSLASGTFYLGVNSSSDYWRGYASSTLTATNGLTLYKKVTLSSIAVKTTPKTDYSEGEYFDPSDLVITLTYSDNSTEDVAYSGHASDFTFSPTTSTALETSNTSVSITYGGKSTSQAITVTASGCTNNITINKGSESHGTFTIDKEGPQPTCSGLIVVVTPSAADHYSVGSVSATTGEIGVDNGNGTWTITYAADVTGTSTINVVFNEDTKYTLNYQDGTGDHTRTNVYVGTNLITALGSHGASCDGTSTTFMGWSTSEIVTKTSTAPSYVAADAVVNSTTAASKYYAVYAKTGDESKVFENSAVSTSGAPEGWAKSGTGTYSNHGVKFDTQGDYITSPDLHSLSLNVVKVKFKAGRNGSDGSILTFYALDSEGKEIDSETFMPTEAYNANDQTVNSIELSGSKVIYNVQIKMTTKESNYNLGMEYCELFYIPYTDYLTTCCDGLDALHEEIALTSGSATITWDAIDGVTAWSVTGEVHEGDAIDASDIGAPTLINEGAQYQCEISNLEETTTYDFMIHATTITSGYCTNVNAWPISGTTEANWTIGEATNDETYGTVSRDGNIITGTPKANCRYADPAYTVYPANSATVVQNGNTFTVTPSANTTVTINFEPIPTPTVKWYVNGGKVAQKDYLEGTSIADILEEAPEVTDNALNASCGSTKFIGWVTAEYTANDGDADTYNDNKVDGEATLSAAANYYAMFATATTDEWNRVDALNAITAGTYVIVSKAADNDYYMLPNATNTSSAQAVSDDYKVTRNNDGSKITSTVPAGAEWSFTINNQSKYIIKNAEDKYLYATNTNNGLRVGSTEDTWTISVNGSAPAFLMTESNNTRCCGIYGSQDWRCYANTEQGLGNYPDGGKVYLYKHNINYEEYRTGCTCNTVTVAIGTHDNGKLKLDGGDANVSHETCTASSVEVRVAPNATYQFAAENAVTFNMGTTGLTAPSSYEPGGDARVYTVSIPKGTAAGTITVNATFVSLPKYGINLSGVSHLTNLASTPATVALGGETVTLSYDDVEDGYTFLNWIVKGATTNNTIPVTNNQFQMPNDEGVVVTADIRENVSVAFYVGTTPYGDAAETYQGGTISLPASNPTESFDATNYPYFIGWSATNFGAVTSAPALVTGDETIDASTSYYAVFADKNPSEMTNNYGKVTTTGDLVNNCKYVIAAWDADEEKHYAATGALTSNTYYLDKVDVTDKVSANVVSAPANSEVWTAKVANSKVQFQNASTNKYMNYTINGTHTNFTLTDNSGAEYVYAVSDGAWVFTTANSKQIEYYDNENKDYFSYHTAQDAPIYLYKQLAQTPTKWATKQIEEVTVSFNDNVAEEEITVPANEVVESGSDLDLSGFTPGARAGYQFSGWSLTTNGAVISSLSNITENTPLYAIWAPNPNCTIKFSVRGTVKDALQETILQGQIYSGFASKEIAQADEVEGYTFLGWASSAQLAETTNAITPMTSYTPEVEASASEITVYALYKRVSAGADVTDEITASQLPATSGYYSFDDVTITSDAVYAGATAYSGGNIQINNNANPNKGIVSITSGGILKSIAITWGSSSNTLDIYASNAAYEEIGELYGNTPKGEVVHSFTATGSYTFADDYSYIGIRSHSGAIYLSKISITWATSTTYYTTRPTQLWAVEYDLDGGEWKSGEGCADGTVQEGEYTVCTDVPVKGEDKLFDKWQINGVDVTTATVNITEATTFTAVWKDRGHGTVTYSANGGIGDAPAAEDVWENEEVTVVANTFFTNPGYSFGGWDITYNDGENIRTITPDANNQFDMPAYDVTIAAVWSRKSTDKWTRVTSADQLVAGEKYVIANVDATYAMGGQNTNNRAAIEIDKVKEDGSIITISENVKEFTLGGSTNAWTFQDASGYLYAAGAATTKQNYLRSESDLDEDNWGVWTISLTGGTTITSNGNSDVPNMRYNDNNGFFSCYNSASYGQAISLYIKAPKVDVTTEVDASVITAEGTDVTVKKGGILNIDAEKSVGDVHVENGGQMALTQNMEAHDLYLEAKAGQSAQVSGIDKMTLSGNVYIDIQLCNGSLDANYWYSIAVPFDVNLNDGVFLADGTQLTNRSDFEVWGYNTALRAQTQSNGWERVKDNMMHAGKAYLIGFNPGQPNIVRLKAADGWQAFTGNSISVAESTGSGDHDNWNGLANPTMRYIDVDKDAQVFNNNTHGWDTYALDAARYNFVVGTAFFVQSASAVTISNTDHGNYRAPKRVDETKCAYAVRITREEATNFDNQIIVRASEEATGTYTQGHDMLTMNGTSSNTAALLWTENYGGKRLAIEEAAWLNGTATYELKMYAPKAGTYSISVAETKDNADLYLTYEGSIIWNLSMGAYEFELAKGATNGYGLLLQAKAPSVATGVEEVQSDKVQCTKVVIDDHVYILRGGQMYDVTGKTVK